MFEWPQEVIMCKNNFTKKKLVLKILKKYFVQIIIFFFEIYFLTGNQYILKTKYYEKTK